MGCLYKVPWVISPVVAGFAWKWLLNDNFGIVNYWLSNAGIVRNRLKVRSAVDNARSFLKVQEEFGSFDTNIWRFVGGQPKKNAWKSIQEIPAQSDEAVLLSKDLIKRGFRLVGPTICYAHMQATGLVNDHTVDCFRYSQLS